MKVEDSYTFMTVNSNPNIVTSPEREVAIIAADIMAIDNTSYDSNKNTGVVKINKVSLGQLSKHQQLNELVDSFKKTSVTGELNYDPKTNNIKNLRVLGGKDHGIKYEVLRKKKYFGLFGPEMLIIKKAVGGVVDEVIYDKDEIKNYYYYNPFENFNLK